MQESFWWWQCSNRYKIYNLPLPPPPYPLPPLPTYSSSLVLLVSFMVSVDIKHHVYLAASGHRKITKHTRFRVKVFHLDTTATTSTRLYTQIVSRNAVFRALVRNLFFMPSQLLWLYLGRFFRAHKCLFCMKLTKKKWLACLHFRNMALHYDETQKTSKCLQKHKTENCVLACKFVSSGMEISYIAYT